MRIYRWLSASVGRHVGLATLFAGMALFLDAYGAAAQTCAAGPVFVDGTSCTVTAGSSITVSQAAVPGLDARNAGATITAQGITVQLGPGVVPRTFVGAQALSGAAVELSGSTIITSQAGTGQRGVISDGFGSNISATGLTITLGTGATTVNDNLACSHRTVAWRTSRTPPFRRGAQPTASRTMPSPRRDQEAPSRSRAARSRPPPVAPLASRRRTVDVS